MNIKKILFGTFIFALVSFVPGKEKIIEFSYPKVKDAVITLTTDKFKKFKEEWRDQDYYYMSENGEDNFICSVLFYKLNKTEVNDLQKIEKKSGVQKGSPIYPLAHFSSSSSTRQYESNEHTWGDPAGDFMFSQVDIKEFAGQKVNQKNMFAYAMFGEDLYVKVHLSKVLCTPEDSTVMVQILDGLKKKK